MSFDPAHQSVPLAHFGTTSDAIPAAIGPSNPTRNHPPSSNDSPRVAKNRKRKSSKMKQGLSRSASTPHMRAVVSDSESEKKRNKLGYQRISIACAHCRRRKIRCLVAEGDPQQRCQNCIRLKKECVFYPVDQQTAMDKESSTRHGVGSNPASVGSSSPPTESADRPEHTQEFGAFSSLPSNAPDAYEGLPLEPGSALPSQGNFAHPDFGYRTQGDARPPWSPPNAFNRERHPILPSNADPSMHASWRYNTVGLEGNFAPILGDPTHASQSVQHPSPFAFSQPGNEWYQTRSMSYSNIESLPQHHAAYAAPFHPSQQTQPHPIRYPPASLDTHAAPMLPQLAGSHSAPVGTPPQHFGPQPPFMFQHDRSGTSSASISSHQAYPSSWYSEPTSFGALEEEPESYGSGQRFGQQQH